jgi:hypothetical protein
MVLETRPRLKEDDFDSGIEVSKTCYDREALAEVAAYAVAAAASRPRSWGAYLGCLMNLGTES